MQTLPEFIEQVLARAEPLSQNTGEANLGFGWLYYGLVRNLRPDFVVAIGSRRGFMPFCAARALLDNGRGRLLFIDPSYEGDGPPGWSGRGLWSNAAEVRERIDSFGLTGVMEHLKLTSRQAFPRVCEMVAGAYVGLVIIDGAHSYENSLEDFDLYSQLIGDGFVLFHDSTSQNCGVPRAMDALRARGLAVSTVHREVGLSLVEVRHTPRVADAWSYLCSESNRGERVQAAASELFRAGDRVFDVYCGFSPIAAHLADASIFGCDRDPEIIAALRRQHPRHDWRPIEELRLPFAELPGHIDVLVGLGLSRGHHWQDPHYVLENVRYLVGRYRPRSCLFEAAADYHRADILDDVRAALDRHGYHMEEQIIDTNLAQFHRRKLLLCT